MNIDTRTIVSVTEANQELSRVTKIVEEYGQAVLFKNNRPRYLVIDMEKSPAIDMTDDEKLEYLAARILKKHKEAFLELAK